MHLDSEPERLPVFREAIAGGRLADGYAADDGAALVFAGDALHACVASGPSSRILRLAGDGCGGVAIEEMATEMLSQERDHEPVQPESFAVSELRALRAGRHRWD